MDLEVAPRNKRDMQTHKACKEALSIASTVYEAEKQEKFNENFYTRFDESVRLTRRSPCWASCERDSPSHSADTRRSSRTSGQYHKYRHSAGKKTPVSEIHRNPRIKVAPGATSTKAWDIFQETVPQGWEGKPISLTCRGGKSPASGLRVRVPPLTSPRL